MEVWARSVVAGIPDELYWASTPVEVTALLDAIHERESRQERDATLRAGLVAAAVYNTLRTKDTDKVWQARDFIAEPKKPLTPEEATMAMRMWMHDVNRRFQA